MQLFGYLIVGNVILNFGSCDSVCQFDRVGPNCQFKNIAYKKLSRQVSNTIPPHYSDEANDDNLATCSYTSDDSTTAPWWNLWLSEYTTFKKLEFVTVDSHLSHFPYFEVKVYNTTELNFQKKRPVSKGIVCYNHNKSEPQSKKINIKCDGYPVGNLIRVQLHRKRDQLVLCDFRLYGDCFNGFYGNDCQKCSDNCESSGHQYCDSNNGRCLQGCKPGWKGDHCETKCENDMWGEDCRRTCGKCDSSACNHITGECPRGCSAGYKPPYCDTVCDGGFYGTSCSRTCSSTCERSSSSSICNNVNGTCLSGCKAGYKGPFCEKECDDGKWGSNCTYECGKCDKSVCNRTNGVCEQGCAAGFKSQRCKQKCDNGSYGKDCQNKCNNCLWSGVNALCDNVYGTCSNGCKAGYRGSRCDIKCEDGKWGLNCTKDCGKCLTSPCNHVNGYCHDGCAVGYKKTWDCHTECDNGTFGKECKSRCSDNCVNVCDKKTGICSDCKAGWKGDRCLEECDDGKWGKNCTKNCGKCLTTPCNHENGNCQDGCAVGYKKTWDCHNECDIRTYGKECKGRCSDNCVDICDKKTGMCSDCKTGWKGDICTKECDPGKWGKQCRDVCGKCVGEEPCDRFNGTCVHGCLPGFKRTLTCEDECEDGRYGNSCLYNCSHTCKGMCNKINGTCDQCRQFWTGHFCEKVSDKILSDTEAVTRSHETKLNIVLICVRILCLILAVYATVITVLFIKRKTTQNEKEETGSSLSGRTHADSNVNKTNKTETVTNEAATEATTELSRVDINVIDDESHHYTDLTPDTKDVEATYETIQLE